MFVKNYIHIQHNLLNIKLYTEKPNCEDKFNIKNSQMYLQAIK